MVQTKAHALLKLLLSTIVECSITLELCRVPHSLGLKHKTCYQSTFQFLYSRLHWHQTFLNFKFRDRSSRSSSKIIDDFRGLVREREQLLAFVRYRNLFTCPIPTLVATNSYKAKTLKHCLSLKVQHLHVWHITLLTESSKDGIMKSL